MVNKTSGSFEV